MENLEIYLFGGLHISQKGAAVDGFRSGKAAALLAYLAVTRRPHRRDGLAGLLWGELPDSDAANNLRQTLTNLRKVAEPCLTISREEVVFNPNAPHFLDVSVFLGLLQASRGQPPAQRIEGLRQALALYQGDFLAGFYVRDAPDFEEWVLMQRVHYRDLALEGFAELTQLLLGSGRCQEAAAAAAQLLALDSWREEAHCWRMLALARCGQSSAALAQYQQCRAILRQEFDAEPSAETTALYQRIRTAQSGPRHNLPAATTGFVGRETELAELRRLLASPDTHLLTLLGPGGVGKTRLALEVARTSEATFLNGVCFVSLPPGPSAPLDQFVQGLAQALGCSLSGAQEPKAQLQEFLRQREILLVLDNLEDWLDAAPWLSQLLTHAPDVKILATSRQRLDLQAEQVYFLNGLSLSAPGNAPLDGEAAQLFLRQAQRVNPGFHRTGAEATAVLEICRLVEGLPLGIELAASWTGQLTCAQIAGEIERSLDFLVTTHRDVPARQRSLHATFDWSWSRLSKAEQGVFSRLAVFRGPFTLDAAQATAEASLPLLSALADKSLAWRRGQHYQLHELARQYGREKLEKAGELEETQARHAHYHAQFLAQELDRLQGHNQTGALAAIEERMGDVRAAWEWLAAHREMDGLCRATDTLYHFLAIRSRFREGVELFGAARLALQAKSDGDGAAQLVYSRVMAREGRFLSFLSRYTEARKLLEESLTIARQLEQWDEMAFALNHLGGTARMEGHLALAEEQIQECLALRQKTGNLQGQAVALLELGGISFMAAEYATSRARCEEGLTLAEAAGDQQTSAHLLTGLSLIYRERGEYDQALLYARRGQAMYESLDDRYGVIQALLTLGELSRRLGHSQEARDYCQQAVIVSEEIGHRSGEADGHYRLGQVAADQQENAEALEEYRLALHLAYAIDETPAVLDTLLEIGSVWLATGATERADTIYRFLATQPQLSESSQARLAQIAPEADRAQPQKKMALADIVWYASRS